MPKLSCFLTVVWLVSLTAFAAEPDSDASGRGIELRLDSDYIPLGVRLQGDPEGREIRSFRLVGQVPLNGDGAADVWLDSRLAELNAFGDIISRIGPEPTAVHVQLRHVATGTGESTIMPLPPENSPASKAFRRYELVFPTSVLGGGLKLVLGTTNLGPHRLLIFESALTGGKPRSERGRGSIVPLHGIPVIRSAFPDAPLRPPIHLSGYYTGSADWIHRVTVDGIPGGEGKLVLDPNSITFDSFGEPVMSTLIGYRRHEITLQALEDSDPQGQGRRFYWAVPNDSRNTNRVAVVLCRTETGPHRILLYHGDQVAFIVPAHLADRRQQEIKAAEFSGLPGGEQQALADLRAAIGNDFYAQTEHGQTIDIQFPATNLPPEGVLARLPHLRSVGFRGGQFPAPVLLDLPRLANLTELWFVGGVFEADGMAMLKDLTELERLEFRHCRGINDEGVKHLAALTGLKWLSFYTEEILKDTSDPHQCVTDVGLACLKDLARLKKLDLFGHDVSDASVPILSRMTDLEDLALSGRGFTDAGLRGLMVLPKLRILRLFETGVTTNGVAAIKAQKPGLKLDAGTRDSLR